MLVCGAANSRMARRCFLRAETPHACAGLARVRVTADHTRGELTTPKTIALQISAERRAEGADE